MILGVGIDTVEIGRVERAFLRHRGKWVFKMLTVEERTQFHQRLGLNFQRGMDFLATRFAAKEACIKALSTTHPVKTWRDWRVISQLNGAPQFEWAGRGTPPPVKLLMSISDDSLFAQAIVVAESRGDWDESVIP